MWLCMRTLTLPCSRLLNSTWLFVTFYLGGDRGCSNTKTPPQFTALRVKYRPTVRTCSPDPLWWGCHECKARFDDDHNPAWRRVPHVAVVMLAIARHTTITLTDEDAHFHESFNAENITEISLNISTKISWNLCVPNSRPTWKQFYPANWHCIFTLY